MGKYEAAIADYDKAIQLKPDEALAYANRGFVKSQISQLEAAIDDCNEAIRLDPDLVVAYNNRGIVKARLGQHEAAIADYDEADKVRSRLSLCLCEIGGL